MTGAEVIFLDFEASSLAKASYPIEVAWVTEHGEAERHLIRPAPGWTDWSAEAERLHGLDLGSIRRDGTPHDVVAFRMLERLRGHKLYATAPSWDGKWLSRLLRGAGLPRHALRLADSDEAHRRVVERALKAKSVPPDRRGGVVEAILAAGRREVAALGPVAHRALDDARRELDLFRAVERLARAYEPTGSP